MRGGQLPENIVLAIGIIVEAIRRGNANTLDYNGLKSEHTDVGGAAVSHGVHGEGI